MVEVRGSYASPVVAYTDGASSILSGTATTVGATVFAANPGRKIGVFVQNTAFTTGRLLVGSTSADAAILLETFGANGNGPNFTWVYGTGAVYVKAATANTTYVAMEY